MQHINLQSKPALKSARNYNLPNMDRGLFERLREARQEAGLPTGQSDIARELGVSPAAVHYWEKKEGGIRLSHALQLAYSAGVCVEWLLTGRGPKKAVSDSSTVAELLRLLETLDPETQREILNFARFQAESD